MLSEGTSQGMKIHIRHSPQDLGCRLCGKRDHGKIVSIWDLIASWFFLAKRLMNPDKKKPIDILVFFFLCHITMS